MFKGLNLSMYEYKELVMNPTSQSLNQSKRSMEQTWEVKSSSTCSMLKPPVVTTRLWHAQLDRGVRGNSDKYTAPVQRGSAAQQ